MNIPKPINEMTTKEFLELNEEARIRSEMREKVLMDERSAIAWATEKGIEQGIKEGTIIVARSMLREGLTVQLVAEITGLTEEEIINLQTKKNK
jgi:predicted transposase/invertase (TIGR01784 family)